MRRKTTHNVSPSDYVQGFSQQVEQADQFRFEALQRLNQIRGARQKSQQREYQRLLFRHGEEHTKVTTQGERVYQEKEMTNYLSVMIDKSVADIAPAKDNFLLQGKLRNDGTDGIANYKIRLIDEKNAVVGEAVTTDADGNYRLAVGADINNEGKQFRIEVLDDSDKQVHIETLPVTLKGNILESRDIVIAKIDKVNRTEKAMTQPKMVVQSKADARTKTTGKKRTTHRRRTTNKPKPK